jgi:hypothetical protein
MEQITMNPQKQSTPAAKRANATREQLRNRAHRYKVAATAAALALFGGFGVAIAHPDLGFLAGTPPTSTQNVSSSSQNTTDQSGISSGTTTTAPNPITTSSSS